MLAKRVHRAIADRALLGFAFLTALSVACGGSEFSASDDPARGAAAGAGGDSGAGGQAGKSGSGGTSGGSAGSAGTSSASASCEAYVQAVCEWEGRCGTGLTGSLEACLRLYENSCAWYALPGSTVGANHFMSCASSYEATACEGAVPTCELPAGSIANGLPCATYVQCESGYCTGSSGACGVCAPHPHGDIGAPCETYANCKAHLHCVDGECAERSKEGEACGGALGCSVTLTCVEGTCQLVGVLGGPCYEANGVSVCELGAGCSNGLCVPLVKAMAGEPCGVFEDQVVDCHDGICRAPDSSPENLECVAWAGPGESCNKVPGFSRCAAGLTCNDSRLCVWPTPVAPPDDCD
jgi:hypothetical protein